MGDVALLGCHAWLSNAEGGFHRAEIGGVLDFFLNDAAPAEIYTLSLHDALPILALHRLRAGSAGVPELPQLAVGDGGGQGVRSEEHTSELQSLAYLVCRLLR